MRYYIFSILLTINLFWTGFCYAYLDCEKAFTNVYENNIWGTGSGSGSKVENCYPYISFLQKFLRENNIKSVVDLGCGDWQFSQFVDWEGIQYLGIDCVLQLIDENNKKFSSKNINFIYADATKYNLPPADLLLCKDCLQHLSFESIHKILSQLTNFKYCLITNDVNELEIYNCNIENGEYRCLDLTKGPFFLTGSNIFRYIVNDSGGQWIKQVFCMSRD